MTGESDPVKFSATELIGTRRASRWAGGSNLLTTDCPGCRFNLTHQDRTQTCEWGVTWKFLVPRQRGERACALLTTRPSPREQRIIQDREFAKALK